MKLFYFSFIFYFFVWFRSSKTSEKSPHLDIQFIVGASFLSLLLQRWITVTKRFSLLWFALWVFISLLFQFNSNHCYYFKIWIYCFV